MRITSARSGACSPLFRCMSLGLLVLPALSGSAVAQQLQVSGHVTSVTGQPLAGVTVRVEGTDLRASTAADGSYAVAAPADGALIFNAIGYRPLGVDVRGRTSIDVRLEQAVAMLDELIVVGYTDQRRADITGAVSHVDMASIHVQTSASVLQRLSGQVSGLTVENSGSPGSRTTVRIRGITSFLINDPLYVIDGTPTQGTYFNWLNPSDIESIEVLKDASVASIYGSRASNGVVVIETRKQSQQPRLQLDVRVGQATPTRGYDDFLILDALEYHEIIKRSYENAGLAVPQHIFGDPDNPSIPAYIWPNDGEHQTTTVDESTYSWPDNLIMRGSAGTNWWDAVFGPALVGDVNLGFSGSATSHSYNVSLNYLDQEGTAAYNRFRRGSVRINTAYEAGPLTIGENIAGAYTQSYGGAADPYYYPALNSFLGKNLLTPPVVPVYDIAGNFAGAKAAGLGGVGNPLKVAWANKDNVNKGLEIFGNVFAGLAVRENLRVNTRFGWNLLEQSGVEYTPAYPEHPEPSYDNRFGERYGTFQDWTWSSTLHWTPTAGAHAFAVLLGQEANRQVQRFGATSIKQLVTSDINARYIGNTLGNPATLEAAAGGFKSSLLSFFGKVDYNYAQRYYLSATLRRDGSSRLGPDHRWGTFPAFNAGWRLSEEPFMRERRFFTNIMLRFGWGITGNQNIPAGRLLGQYAASLEGTDYAIGGGDTLAPGLARTAWGNPNLKWEENTSVNLGLDLEFLQGHASLTVDAYSRTADDLLFDPLLPATAGQLAQPIVNIGMVRNTGFDFALGYRGQAGSAVWSLTLNGGHYRNSIVRIDGQSDSFLRAWTGWITTQYEWYQIGYPIGAFWGYEWDGFFENAEAVARHAVQEDAAPGRLRFVDQPTDNDGDGIIDGPDGVIDRSDLTYIGNPHPDFTAGLDFSLTIGPWDVGVTVFGMFGNDIWDQMKNYYVLHHLGANVRRDVLTESAVVEDGQVVNLDVAKYPVLEVNNPYRGTQSSFFVEDGSYVRLRNLQLGYRLPLALARDTRVYVQAENLFTITGYPGLDPALPLADVTEAAGAVGDMWRGNDVGAYPSSRVFSVGVSARF